MSGDTVYGYFKAVVPVGKLRKIPNGGVGYVCVRLDRPPKDSSGTNYKASFSFCSPIDAPCKPSELNRFFKAKSRHIADCRMTSSRIKGYIEFDLDKKPDTLPDLMKVALDRAKTAPSYKDGKLMAPEWFQIAVDVKYGLL